jgi:short-subunit dehydrogenase
VIDVAGLRCVVTGPTSGIGQRLALALVERGAIVWALGRSEERLGELIAAVEGLPGRVVPVVADLETEDDVVGAAAAILAQTDCVDLLVHSAGAIELGTFGSLPPAALDRMYRVNLRAPYALTRDLLEALRLARGQVVFVNSSAALRASVENVLYAATKHGLKALADGLRDTVNADGVRVISVFLGRTATPMQRAVHEHEGRDYRPELLLSPNDAVDVVLAAVSMPRSAEVTDVNLRPMQKLGPA